MKRSVLDLLSAEQLPAKALVSKLWRRYALRNVSANDNHRGLDRLYALPDPWGMTSERERSRFTQTNAIIESRLGRVGSILEIGCGEGHQSEYLTKLCRHLDGLDVSERAVSRAQQRHPAGRFAATDLTHLPWQPESGRYDLVVACEVLYYMSDIAATVQRMSELGRSCLVTFFCPSARLVAQHVESLPGVERGWIYHDPYAWLWALWRSP